MAEIQDTGGKNGNSKQKKMTVRVDFTPMVDMNMLLITFFMLCTSLSKPQTMEISMPSNDKNITEVLAGDDKIYYYEGEPNYEDYTSLKESDYTANGIEKVLLAKNATAVKEVAELKVKKENLEINEEEYKKQVAEVKGAKDTPTVIIKATDDATYKNLIDALDEMQICSIGKYVIVDITEGDQFLIDNYLSKGELSSQAAQFES